MEEEMNKLVTLPYVSSAFNFQSFTKIIGDLSVCQLRTEISQFWGPGIHGLEDYLRSTLIRFVWALDFFKIFWSSPESVLDFLLTFSVMSSPIRTGALGPEPIGFGTWTRELVSTYSMLHSTECYIPFGMAEF